MIVVVGHLVVEAGGRDGYVAACRDVVERARSTPGCLDFAVSADPVDPSRVNVSEQWDSPEALADFRQEGPDSSMTAQILQVRVVEYAVAHS